MEHREVRTYFFSDDGTIPNNRLPLVVFYHGFQGDEQELRQVLLANGWGGIWVNGVYDYHHFHSTAHELLAVLSGSARLMLGGEKGEILDVRKGDVLVLPAGTGHKCLTAEPDFSILGAYPNGQDWDLRTGKPEERQEVLNNIKNVKLPGKDPLEGDDGKLLELWPSS